MNWDADSQLVRGNTNGLNLAIGDPVFLRENLKPFFSEFYPYEFYPGTSLGYPDTKPIDSLQQELEDRYPGKYVVVTNGAKQALHAAIRCSTKTASWVSHRAPYWPSHPTAAQLNGRGFCDTPGRYDIFVNTSPNNPDGTESLEPCDIWDASYAHSVYGWSGQAPPHKASVWSAGKLIGVPGIRLGWLVTEDQALAERVSRYVEQTTSGVAITSQYFASKVLPMARMWGQNRYDDARQDLFDNSNQFKRLLPYIDTVSGFPMHERGMFAWFKVKDPEHFDKALKKSTVLLVKGSACGMTETGWYRMSLGNRPDYHEKAISCLEEALKE